MVQPQCIKRYASSASLDSEKTSGPAGVSLGPPQQRTLDDMDSCPSPAVRKYEGKRAAPRNASLRIPPFRESKRWAKMYVVDSVPPTPPPKDESPSQGPSADVDDRVLTMRETSFEQQRAELKKPLSPKPETEDTTPRPRHAGDSTADLHDGGLCRSRTPQCWKSVKATVTVVPTPNGNRWLGRRSMRRRVAPKRHRDVKFRRASGRVALPAKVQVNGQNRARQSVTSPKQLPILPRDARVLNDPMMTRTRVQRPASPVPSLHDPEKDSRFANECRELLRTMSFDQDWLLPAASVLPAVGPPPRPRNARPSTQDRDRQQISMQDALRSAPPVEESAGQPPYPNITVTQADSAESSLQPPDPPARSSSKTVASLVSLMQMARPRALPVVSETSVQSFLTAQEPMDRSASTTERSKRSQSLLRMPSARSASGRSFKGPRAVKSMDTLAKIEAQVQSSPPTHVGVRLEKVPSTGSDHRHSGPPSIPPERPLPALPIEAQMGNDRLSGPRRRSDGQVHDGNRKESRETIRGSPSPVRRVRRASPPSSVPPGATSIEPPQGARDHAPEAEPAVAPIQARHSLDRASLPSLRSQGSRGSVASSRSYSRHSICGARADKVRERRMRDLASSKSPSSASVNSAHHEAATPSRLVEDLAMVNIQHLVDQLDQFPAVPASRPSSINNASASGHARGHSHGSNQSLARRHLSKPGAGQARPGKAGQVLGQSNIFVVVDSDPVTARFRAGAMSPTPSMGGAIHGRTGSPIQAAKQSRGGSNLREMTVHDGSPQKGHRAPTGGPSARSSSIPARKNKRSARSNSVQPGSSSDESHALMHSTSSANSAAKHSSRPPKRRRWNSTDISMIKILQRDLEDYYSTIQRQEERIRWQADQIRMMIRVIAPMNRARGVKTPSYLGEDAAADVSTADEDEFLGLQFAQRLSSGGRAPRRPPKTGLPSPASRPGSVETPKKHRRVDDAGDDSTASASAAAATTTYASSINKASADDASLTDPVDYGLTDGTSEHLKAPETSAGGRSPAPAKSPLHLRRPSPVSSPSTGLKAGNIRASRLPVPSQRKGYDVGREKEADRLSVNHVLTDAERMDRAIDDFRCFV